MNKIKNFKKDIKIKISIASAKEADAIYHIFKKSIAKAWEKDSIYNDIKNNENSFYIVAMADENVVGALSAWKVLDEAQIMMVAVDCGFRGNGIGCALMRYAVDRLCSNISLEVRKSNDKAIGLYEKFGFNKIGLRKKYYIDNGEDAIIMERRSVKILGIETSCDETAASIVEDGRNILSNIVSSQIDIHQKFGGVVPEIASRHHLEDINRICDLAVSKAGINWDDIDIVAVTRGPGLIGSLLVGVSAAKAISFALDKPLMGIHHISGHIAANYLTHKSLEPPFLSLVVSGGHTSIIDVNDYDDFRVIGSSRDDAAGEAFDKVARVLGLGYPGGPKIEEAAKNGDPKKFNFKRVMLEKGSYDFSFSGLKTAVLNEINSMKQKKEEIPVEDIAAGFQKAVIDVLVAKAIDAAIRTNKNKIVLAGGVTANKALSDDITIEAEKQNIKIYYPDIKLCTDNAAMIASAAYYSYISGAKFDDMNMDATAVLDIEDYIREGF